VSDAIGPSSGSVLTAGLTQLPETVAPVDQRLTHG
jgi:hypothetical protein